jgi:osmoprotectant transport system ATP-binding protein
MRRRRMIIPRPMIALEGVSKRLGGKLILAPTSLTVAAKTTVALLGPSGCGKSTLLRLIIGLLTPDTGSVKVTGEEVTAASAPAIRRRIGYVIQDGGLFPHLTAGENTSLMARHLGWESARVRDRLDELCELVRLDPPLLGRYPVELSGGQRQRVGLMRGLMLDPDLLLLDEPMGALDPIVRARLQEDLKGIFAALKKTVMLVTHDLGEAAYLAEDVVLMRGGHILQRGALRDLATRPADPFVSDFLESQRAPWQSEWSA